MKIIDQRWTWITQTIDPLLLIEKAGRTCYKSEKLQTLESKRAFSRMLLDSGHESVIEHANATVKFITNRGVTHELVRHRLASYSQESTRYVNYKKKGLTFIKPVWLSFDTDESNNYKLETWYWLQAMEKAEYYYLHLLELGWTPEQAREVLPNSLKTEIVMTANLREWRHIFKLRTSKRAHPQMRKLMLSCLSEFKQEIPIIFDDIMETE
jgi:thymidylate synthase (FAD)